MAVAKHTISWNGGGNRACPPGSALPPIVLGCFRCVSNVFQPAFDCFVMSQMCFRGAQLAPDCFGMFQICCGGHKDALGQALSCCTTNEILKRSKGCSSVRQGRHHHPHLCCYLCRVFSVVCLKKLSLIFKSSIKGSEGQTILCWVCKAWQRTAAIYNVPCMRRAM